MKALKLIETVSTDTISPFPTFIVRHIDTGLWYLSDGTSTLIPIGIPGQPQTINPGGAGDYTVGGTEQLIIITDASYDVIYDQDNGYNDGFTCTIKNIANQEATVRIASGDTARFEDTQTEIILSPYDSATIVKYGTNYYIL